MNIRAHELSCLLATIPQAPYPSHSRVHRLKTFSFPSTHCFVKREDELGFGLSGSKIRKYRTLIPHFLNAGIQEVVLIGSAYSNHILSLTQLLVENDLHPKLFLRGDSSREQQGNALLTNLLVPPSSIEWISKSNWKNVESQAQAYAATKQHPIFVLNEGGFCAEALPGALTLPLDILQNEKELGVNFHFDHLFIDAGTGFTASALILGLSWIGHPSMIHVVLLAEDPNAFLARLRQCHKMFAELLRKEISFPQNFVLHVPKQTPGFGEINSSIFENIAHICRHEGFLTDPVYTAKLFIESKSILQEQVVQGHVLIHHSGGALTLMGFQKNLQRVLSVLLHNSASSYTGL